MSTIRERDAAYRAWARDSHGVPVQPLKECPADHDRFNLIVAGDAIARALEALTEVADRRPAHRGQVVSHDIEAVHVPGETCTICFALALWKQATDGGAEARVIYDRPSCGIVGHPIGTHRHP